MHAHVRAGRALVGRGDRHAVAGSPGRVPLRQAGSLVEDTTSTFAEGLATRTPSNDSGWLMHGPCRPPGRYRRPRPGQVSLGRSGTVGPDVEREHVARG